MRNTKKIAAVLAITLMGGCQNLLVDNTNDPDRGRAVGQAAAVEALISSGFGLWWNQIHQNEPAWALSFMADEFSGGFLDYGGHHSSQEPRVAWDNSPTFTYNDASESPWYGLHSVISNMNDALTAMNNGVVPVEAARARAVAKFMQGISRGYLALYLDSAWVVNENTDLQALAANPQLRPYSVAMDSALSELQQAIVIAQANSFTIPGPPGWFRTPLTNVELARLARSFMARFMASVARTRAARDAVDWDSVLALAEQGIQADLMPIAEAGVFENGFTFRAARQRTTIPSDFARPDNWLLGPADSTQAFINWVNTPVASRERFQLITKDRRIHGPAGPTDTTGKYFRYHNASVWNATRGTYHRSNYAYYRLGRGTSWQVGPQLAMTVTEMNLLRAEALIRLNRALEAVPLINQTRIANGQLAPVTILGPPDTAGCVPRKYMPGASQGACGSLWDALRYEKRIEMAGVDPTVAYLDARGWQTLVQNTYIQFPVPGRELGVLQRPMYTYGGGQLGSAPAPDPERCPSPAPLSRCP
jgi:hypothetical protein